MKLWLCLFVIPVALLGAESRKLSVLPAVVELATAESRQQLLAELESGSVVADWTRAATWTSSAPDVAKVDAGGKVSPVGDGEALITAAKDGLTADSLSTAVSVMSPERGIRLAEGKGACVRVVRKPAERVEIRESDCFRRFVDR